MFLGSMVRRRVAVVAAVVLALGYALATGGVPGVGAIFTADTENPNSAASGGWIPAASNASSSLDGSPYSEEHLGWVSGRSTTMPSGANPVTGQVVMYADGGNGGSANCGSYSSFSTVSATATAADVTGSDIADWWCFEVYSTSASSWVSGVTSFTARRLFVPTGTVTLANGVINGYAFSGDSIQIPFNQTPSSPGTISVELCTSGVIQLGSSSCGTAGSIGTITGLTISASAAFTRSTTTVNGSTLTITLGGGGFTFSKVGGAGSFTAGGSAISTGGEHACTSSSCTVSTGGSF
jgi:hypothetical protein